MKRTVSALRFLLVTAAVLAAALLSGSAMAMTCAGYSGARGCAGGTEIGSGTCADPGRYAHQENGLVVQVPVGSITHTFYANHYCYAFDAGDFSGSGNGVSAGYYGRDSATGEGSSAGASWTGFTYDHPTGSGSECFTLLSLENVPVAGQQHQDLGCPAGAPPGPPTILP